MSHLIGYNEEYTPSLLYFCTRGTNPNAIVRKHQNNSVYKTNWPKSFKSIKVIEIKEKVRNCSRPKAIKQT